MSKTLLLASAAAVFLTASAVQAQTSPTPAAANSQQRGVLTFQPDFFAAQRPATALEMVQRVPGFSVNDGAGSRGFEGAVGNILINGARPASKNDTGSSAASRILAAQVERIELIRGGAPGIDMQGFSEVVNIITKSTASLQQQLQLEGFLFEDNGPQIWGGRYQVTKRDGDRTYGITIADGVSLSDSQGPGTFVRRDATGAILRNEALDSRMEGGGRAIRGNYAGPLMGGKVDLTARYGVNDWRENQTLTNATDFRESPFTNDGSDVEFGLVYERPVATGWKAEGRFIHTGRESESVSLGRTRLAGVVQPEQRFISDSQSSETILRGLLRNERSTALTVEFGAEAAYNMLDTTQAFSIGGAPVALPSATVKVEELRGEVFTRSTWRITPNLSLETGLRFENSTIKQTGDASSEKTLFFAKPRAQLTWTPRPGHQLRGRFERIVGQLNFNDFAASSNLQNNQVFGGNVDLEPEQRWITELTYERRFWSEGVFSIGLRHDEISDAIDRVPLSGGLSAVGNIGDAAIDYLSVSLTLPTDKLGVPGGRFRFGNTWVDSEVTDPTTGRARPISGARDSDAAIRWSQDLRKGAIQWGAELFPGWDQTVYNPDQRQRVSLKNYRVFFTEWKPTPQWSIRGQVNIWDDFEIKRTVYANRQTQAVSFTELRDIDPRTFFQLRIRKTF